MDGQVQAPFKVCVWGHMHPAGQVSPYMSNLDMGFSGRSEKTSGDGVLCSLWTSGVRFKKPVEFCPFFCWLGCRFSHQRPQSALFTARSTLKNVFPSFHVCIPAACAPVPRLCPLGSRVFAALQGRCLKLLRHFESTQWRRRMACTVSAPGLGF